MTLRRLLLAPFTTGTSARSPYWHETRRPFSSLIFLLPLLLAYEIGIVWLGGADADAFRNGADAWIRQFLLELGIDLLWLVPTLVVAALVVWQWVSRQPWRTSWDTLGGMAAESLLFAFALILVGQGVDACFRQQPLLLDVQTYWSPGLTIRALTFLGAGIYEEFLFRLCLIPLAYAACRALLLTHRWSVGITIVATSVLFALAHYLGSPDAADGYALLSGAVAKIQSSRAHLFSFVFRLIAGIFFAGLFFLRGFGIAVGAHAAYDVIVGAVMVSEL